VNTPVPSQSDLAVLSRIYRKGAGDLSALLTTGTDFQKGRAGVLLKQLNAISGRLGLASDKWVSAEVEKLYGDTGPVVTRELNRLGIPIGQDTPRDVIRDQFLKVNEDAVNSFARQLGSDLAGANAQLRDDGRRIISKTSQMVMADPALSEVIAQGLVSGGNLNKIGKALRTRLAEGGQELLDSGAMSEADLKKIVDFDAGVIQAGKRQMDIVDYTNMVASFQLREAVVDATKNSMQWAADEFGGDPDLFDLVQVMGPISGDVCDFYVGKVFSLSGRSSQYPPLASIPRGGPPFHPHCTHNIAPFFLETATPRERERGEINPKFLDIDLAQGQKLYMGNDRLFAARREPAPQDSRSSVPDPQKP